MNFKFGIIKIGSLAAAGMMLAACSMSPTPVKKTKEFFSVKQYGAASPQMVQAGRPVPKGGGRYQVGKAYRVAGKTYVPRDNPSYSEVGYASWYGDAFHGRQTANGEIYDMNDLTAAHPTLPLPSYVRVTNLDNGRSVVVRVNDRGPFANNRIIDVSKTVAGMLGFEKRGVAKVKVDFVGRAQLDGRDRNRLLASYSDPSRPALNSPIPVAAAAAGVKPTPPPRLRTAYAADVTLRPDFGISQPVDLNPAHSSQDLLAPLIMNSGRIASLAPVPVRAPAHAATAAMAAGQDFAASRTPIIVQIGTFGKPSNAIRASERFSRFGGVEVLRRQRPDKAPLSVVRVAVRSSAAATSLVRAAADAGLAGAFIVSQ